VINKPPNEDDIAKKTQTAEKRCHDTAKVNIHYVLCIEFNEKQINNKNRYSAACSHRELYGKLLRLSLSVAPKSTGISVKFH
jgi:hypothetical protein